MIGDLPDNIGQNLVDELAEQIQAEVDFEILYGQLIAIDGKKYILYRNRGMFPHPKYPYIKIKCELKVK